MCCGSVLPENNTKVLITLTNNKLLIQDLATGKPVRTVEIEAIMFMLMREWEQVVGTIKTTGQSYATLKVEKALDRRFYPPEDCGVKLRLRMHDLYEGNEWAEKRIDLADLRSEDADKL